MHGKRLSGTTLFWAMFTLSDNIIRIVFLKSDWGQRWYEPALDDYKDESNMMYADNGFSGDVVRHRIGKFELRPSKAARLSVLMMKGTGEDKAIGWFGKVLLLRCTGVCACGINIDLTLTPFMNAHHC